MIEHPDRMPPFLMHLASDHDHWVYLSSHGAISAGRRNPDHQLFPYYTHDKLFDLAPTIGSVCLLRVHTSDGPVLWEPFRDEVGLVDLPVQHRLYKSELCTKVIFEADHAGLGLTVRLLWSVSRRFGFVRRIELQNTGEACRIEALDGLQNLVPYGLTQGFQAQFSNLADAYKRSELRPDSGVGLYYLSSIPTDRAEPSEALKATVVWSYGPEAQARLLSTEQVEAFRAGGVPATEYDLRARRGAYLAYRDLQLETGQSLQWWTVAEIDQSAAQIEGLEAFVTASPDLTDALQASIDTTAANLKRLLTAADGWQDSADRLRASRHLTNTLNNVLRGGIFKHGYAVPAADLARTIRHFNRPVWQRHQAWLEALPASLPVGALLEQATDRADPNLLRLCREYLPLTFSRRHGDPSRPWNRFSIELEDAQGQPRYAYEGNWRDIFQNWEALMHAFPEFLEASIFRFLNATTADGYNPYRVTKDGFDWEVLAPDEPWSNIGYWGDHQIIYLLRLLEASRRFHPAQLPQLLTARLFVYAHVPYRLKDFEAILTDPRRSIDYDHAAAEAMAERCREIGHDGKLLTDAQGDILLVSLAEKLLVPLLAKLSNYVPDGGIWMNTQRPEWNDANNALAGYGLSVVTLGYLHRYLAFLERLFADAETGGLALSREVMAWWQAQAEVFAAIAEAGMDFDPARREQVMRQLGRAASAYHRGLYGEGLSGETVALSREQLLEYLRHARAAVAAGLHRNRRPDALYHAYNLLEHSPGEGVHIGRLSLMLEGQVSILSAQVLGASEAVELLNALRASPLYEPRQQSYLLYPDQDLPGFLARNRVPSEAVDANPLLQALLVRGDHRIVEPTPSGGYRFNGAFRNGGDLRDALDELADAAADAALVAAHRDAVEGLYEAVFAHRAFTGRSSSFFAYEGLGSIYWHMVSKLHLAIQEGYLAAAAEGESRSTLEALRAHYGAVFVGLGLRKSPELYGAFPTDPYSHTPAHAGAQQPGMTGQVKEDLLVRLGELGVTVSDGCVAFRPQLLSAEEFATEERTVALYDVHGALQTLHLPAGSIAFTFCQVPVVYAWGESVRLRLEFADADPLERVEPQLTEAESQSLFRREGMLRCLRVTLPRR